MSNPYDAIAFEDGQRRDGLMDPWAGIAPEPEILTDEIEVTPRTPEQVNAGMAELLRRIGERDNPQQAARDYAAELAGGSGVRQALAPAMAPATPQMPAASPVVQSPPLTPPPVQQGGPLASTTAPPGILPPAGALPGAPPPAAAAPPALTTPQGAIPPAAPPQDGTAGAESAALAAPRPGGVQPPPQTRPADVMAKGAPPGMGGSPGGVQARMGSGPGLVAQGPGFDQQVADAQGTDDRRERWRRILRGVSALLAAGTGNVGLMLPGMVGASLVPESDEEETLRAGDTREQAMGTEQARRQALIDQLAQRREAAAAQERQGQETLALRARELEGSEADRSLRTGIQLREDEREGDLLDPGSAVSGRERQALQLALQGQPREVAGRYQGLERLSATELRSLRDDLERGGRARTIAGQGRGAQVGGAGGGPLASVDAAPDSYVLAIQQASPGMSAQDARSAANIQWGRLDEERQANWLATPDAQRLAVALRQDLPGYEQTNPGATSPAQFAEAQGIVAGEEAFDVAMSRAIGAAQRVEALPVAEQAGVRLAGTVGIDASDDMAEFNDARGAIISALNRMAGGGIMDASEYARWDAMLPTLASVRGLAPGAATRRLQAAAERARETAAAEMRARGYRRTTQDAPPAPGQGAPQGAPVRMRGPDGTERNIPPHLVRAARARQWVPVEGGS
jgi:hypothetical protein